MAAGTEPPRPLSLVQRITSAYHAFTGKRAATGGYVNFSDDWVSPAVGLWARAFQEVGLRHNHGAMVGMCVQWVGICSAFNAVQRAGAVVRLYSKSGSGGVIGKHAHARVKGRKRIEYLRNPHGASGRKASQYAEMAGEVDEILEHPILDLLHKPNPWMSGLEYERRLAQSLEVPGNGYERFLETGDVIQLLPMPAPWTRVQTDPDDLIRGYLFGADEASLVRYEPDEVIHHREMPAMDNMLYGVSGLRNVLAETGILAMAIDYESNALVNGVRPSNVAFTVGEETTDTQIDQIRTYLKQRYTGSNKSGAPLVLRDATATILNRTAVEMEMREGINYIKQMTLATYGIPEALLMRKDGGALSESGTTQDSAYQNYAKFTLTPKISNVLELRNEKLLSLMGIEPGTMWLACDDPCPPNRDDLREDAKTLVPIGVMEANEAREALSLDPHDEGKGLRYQGKSFETMDRPPPEPGGSDPFGNGDKEKVIQKMVDALGRGEKTWRDFIPGGVLDLLHQNATGLWWKSPQWRELATKDDDRELRPIRMTIRELEIALRSWFKGVQPTIIDSADLATGGVTLAFTPDQQGAFTQAVLPPLEQAGVLGFNKAVADLKSAGRLPGGMDKVVELSAGAAAKMRQGAGRLFKSVESSLTQRIRDSLAEGIDEGEPIGQLTARVKEIAGPGTENASYMIARTEAARSYNTEREDGWKQSGNVQYKRWILSGNACPVCRAMAAKFQKVPVGQPMLGEGESISYAGGTFTNDYAAVFGPPVHPHCACGLVAVF